MVLLLDIGNTRIKWAWTTDSTELRYGGVVTHARDPELLLTGWTSYEPPDRVVAASVAGDALTGAARRWVERRWGVDFRLVRASAEAAGVRNGYAEPGRLGADRWAAIVGAYRLSGTAVCIADCGSAVTVDGVDSGGRHRGGLILPGCRLMRRALHQGTAELPLVDDSAARLFAADTTTAIASGTVLAVAATVEWLACHMSDELGTNAELWLTGGDAPTLIPHLRLPFRHAPDLVLQGLAILAASADAGIRSGE